jgi:Kef-type K+ transport system membrane component KefB/nucleotide-binding universal stress UspA family protein
MICHTAVCTADAVYGALFVHWLFHSSLTLFISQAIVIITFARIVGLAARRLGQPMVIAEVVAGIMLGPSLLGVVAPNALQALFPGGSLALLNNFSQIGLIFFMFLIGLELDPRLLRGRGHSSVVISHSSIILPFALGAWLALYLYPRLSDAAVPFSSFTLFMGAAMSITAFPVLARIMTERRMLRTRIGAITLACAAVDDVTAWCILAFVVSIVRAVGVVDAVKTTGLAVTYILVMIFLIRPFLRRLAARGVSRESLTQNLVAVTFLILLLSSWITEFIGIHALFGAFLLGAIMPREGGYAQALAEKLEDFVVVFLLPLFFAYSGLRTQINLLYSGEAWVFCGLIIFVACLGKFGGSAVAARLTGHNWREASAIGILMNTRGLMELIVLNIGLDLGVISPALFTMMVIMALVTTFMTTPLLHLIYPQKQLELEAGAPVATAPVPRAAGEFNVLMCVANDQTGPAMATLAAAVTGSRGAPRAGTNLYALRMIRPAERTSSYLDVDAENTGGPTGTGLVPLLARSEQLGLLVHPISFISRDPGDDICAMAASQHADLILMGWHKPLFGQTLLGGTVYEVMEQARADVGVLIERGLSGVRRVLVPYYGSPHDRAALRLAQRMNTRSSVDITILHVIRPGRTERDPRLGAQDRVDSIFSKGAEQRGDVTMKVVEHREPVEAALHEAEAGYDLVLVGVGEEWGLEQRRFGLRPEQLIRQCPTSLVVVRAARKS